MNIYNETCIQRVLIHFYYQDCRGRDIRPENIRQWKTDLQNRLERIAQMMDILIGVHDDWAITGRKGYIQMETQSFDFNSIKQVLSEHGFQTNDYCINLDYTRKWGVL